MEPKILKLTEAFCIQPDTYKVCKDVPLSFHEHSWKCVKEIKKVQIDQYEWIYVGYNFNDQKVFEIQSKSVNVFYDEPSNDR